MSFCLLRAVGLKLSGTQLLLNHTSINLWIVNPNSGSDLAGGSSDNETTGAERLLNTEW